MTLAQVTPKRAATIKIWEAPTAEAQVNDIIRKPFCPIARVVGKEILADGRTCLIVTFPGCHDHHVEEWVLETPAFMGTPITPKTTTVAPTANTTAAAILASSKPAAAPTTPTAIGTNGDEPPNRGDNGRGRMQPTAAPKKLIFSLVAVKRISSDIPASNFDQFEFEIAGELSLMLGGFIIPPVVVRDSSGYKIISGHFQYHAAVMARQLNPKAGENIPARVLESQNHATASAMLKMLKFAA
jgi:hypothetical protein